MAPRPAHARRSPTGSDSSRANRRVAIAVALASLPWLAASDLSLFWLGLAACVTAGAVAWLPEFGRPAIVGCGFFVAAAISCHPLLAGTWHPWQASAAGTGGVANAGLVCLPCLLMVVSRTWALDLLRDRQGCDNGQGCDNKQGCDN